MPKIKDIVILYNPNSTGDGKQNAEILQSDLKKASETLEVTLIETKYAGQATEIATSYARKATPYLIVSSSGDGGYHEVVNGILAVKNTRACASLLPSGNANDHYRAVSSGKLVDHILTCKSRAVDVLMVESTVHGEPWKKYAHSYAGIGLSSEIGKQLTAAKLNAWNEKWLVIKHFFQFDHFTIVRNGRRLRVSSLLLANVKTMSKVLTVNDSSRIDDGLFEVSLVSYRSKIKIIVTFLKASATAFTNTTSVLSYKFATTKPLSIQLDGEVYTLDKNSHVRITCLSNALQIIS